MTSRLAYALLAIAMACILFGQTGSKGLRGSAQRIVVHGVSLEGNLDGDSPDRHVSIYLPPSYQTEANRRYPVLYLLHGFTDNDEKWFGFVKHWMNLPEVMDRALNSGQAREMIVVMPDGYTRFQGSWYSSSVTTGDWEDYVARELVGYIDAHYRTLAEPASRGLAGHSMGGYGTARIGMRHPDVFSSLYLLSPCCMAPLNLPAAAPNGRPAFSDRLEAIKSIEELQKSDFFTRAIFAEAAAWSPNPKNPPFYFDLPWKNGESRPLILAKWAANAPLAMVDQYVPNLKRLKAVGMDAGDKDEPIATTVRELHAHLNLYALENTFEIYQGNHINRIPERVESKVLPFFTHNLKF